MRVTATRAVCRARFFEQIRSQDFASGGFYCSFDYYGTDDREDAFVRLYEDGGTIVAELWRRGASTFDYVRDVPGRINIVKDIAIVKVSRSEISGRPHFLKWRGVTHFYNGSSCSGGCSDYVPDTYGSWFRYRYH